MDIKKIQDDVYIKTGIRISENDPLIVILALNEITFNNITLNLPHQVEMAIKRGMKSNSYSAEKAGVRSKFIEDQYLQFESQLTYDERKSHSKKIFEDVINPDKARQQFIAISDDIRVISFFVFVLLLSGVTGWILKSIYGS